MERMRGRGFDLYSATAVNNFVFELLNGPYDSPNRVVKGYGVVSAAQLCLICSIPGTASP